ncbi:17467_t:CDS:2 [Gigaspora rosea]|nr:17467_t:CDS:2 [Gigaspora rosea]
MSDQKWARSRTRYACSGCKKSKRRCDGTPSQRDCSECIKKNQTCIFSVCPRCLNKNKDCICANCLSDVEPQDFDDFQMGNISFPSFVNDIYKNEIYNGIDGYGNDIIYDDIFTYDASQSPYSSLPQLYSDLEQEVYWNGFVNQNEIYGINFPFHSFVQVCGDVSE